MSWLLLDRMQQCLFEHRLSFCCPWQVQLCLQGKTMPQLMRKFYSVFAISSSGWRCGAAASSLFGWRTDSAAWHPAEVNGGHAREGGSSPGGLFHREATPSPNRPQNNAFFFSTRHICVGYCSKQEALFGLLAFK